MLKHDKAYSACEFMRVILKCNTVLFAELGTRYLKNSGAAAIWRKKAAARPLIATQMKK